MKRTAALMSQLDWLHDSLVDVKVLSVWRDVGSFDDGFILNGSGKHLHAAFQHPVNDLPGHLLTLKVAAQAFTRRPVAHLLELDEV